MVQKNFLLKDMFQIKLIVPVVSYLIYKLYYFKISNLLTFCKNFKYDFCAIYTIESIY